MTYLQQSTSVLSSVGNKMPMQESAKVKEKAENKFDKEGMGSTSASFLVLKGSWQWKKYLVKSQHEYKARAVKNHHDDSV